MICGSRIFQVLLAFYIDRTRRLNLFVEHSIVAKARVSFKHPEPMTSTTRAILIPKCDLIITRKRKEIHASSDFTTVNPFEMTVHIS